MSHDKKLVSVAEETDFSLALLEFENPEDRFCSVKAHMY